MKSAALWRNQSENVNEISKMISGVTAMAIENGVAAAMGEKAQNVGNQPWRRA